MTIEISAYRWVPPFAQGYVRDLRVRWALEEAGLPYEVQLIDSQSKDGADYRRWQPFGQVPAYRDGQVEMFESGAIVLHIASRSPTLAEPGAAGHARAASWGVAAINSVEPFAQDMIRASSAASDAPGATAWRAEARASLNRRLDGLAQWLGDKEWLEGRFTAGDLLMVTVLRELVDCGALEPYASLDAYRQRGEARPAFVRAMEAQIGTFRENAPPA